MPAITLNITEDQLAALRDLQEDYAYRKARDQADPPNIYVLVNRKRRVVHPDFAGSDTRREYCDPDQDDYEILIEDLPVHLEEHYPEALAAFLSDHPDFDRESESNVEQLIGTIPRMYSVMTELVNVDAQTFLTRASAEAHLRANRHHYHEQAFVARHKAWRNPVLQSLLSMLYEVEIPEGEEAEGDIEGTV